MGNRTEPVVILLVEDDRGDQELIRRALQESNVAHELHIVEDGEAALDYLYCRGPYAQACDCPAPDLILLDFNLPKLNGMQVLAQMKSDARMHRAPTIVLSTSLQESDIRQCYANGASSCILKPVVLDDFIRMIRCIDEYWFQTVLLPAYEKHPCPLSS